MDIKLSNKELGILKYLDSMDAKSRFGRVTVHYLAAKTNLVDSTVQDILDKLVKSELIEINEFGYPDKQIGYKITTEGETFLEIINEEKESKQKERITWNILVPIFVAFVTAVLTSILIN